MRNKLVAIALLATVSICQAGSDDIEILQTRFGELKMNRFSGSFKFRGRSVPPTSPDYSFGMVEAVFQLAASDVILVPLSQGTACPLQFVYVTVTATQAKVSRKFGTCYDEHEAPIQHGETLTFTQPNVAENGVSKYVYSNGVVFENGKPVK